MRSFGGACLVMCLLMGVALLFALSLNLIARSRGGAFA